MLFHECFLQAVVTLNWRVRMLELNLFKAAITTPCSNYEVKCCLVVIFEDDAVIALLFSSKYSSIEYENMNLDYF